MARVREQYLLLMYHSTYLAATKKRAMGAAQLEKEVKPTKLSRPRFLLNLCPPRDPSFQSDFLLFLHDAPNCPGMSHGKTCEREGKKRKKPLLGLRKGGYIFARVVHQWDGETNCIFRRVRTVNTASHSSTQSTSTSSALCTQWLRSGELSKMGMVLLPLSPQPCQFDPIGGPERG